MYICIYVYDHIYVYMYTIHTLKSDANTCTSSGAAFLSRGLPSFVKILQNQLDIHFTQYQADILRNCPYIWGQPFCLTAFPPLCTKIL